MVYNINLSPSLEKKMVADARFFRRASCVRKAGLFTRILSFLIHRSPFSVHLSQQVVFSGIGGFNVKLLLYTPEAPESATSQI